MAGSFHSPLFEWLTGRRATKGGIALANRITRQSGAQSVTDAKELRRRLARRVFCSISRCWLSSPAGPMR